MFKFFTLLVAQVESTMSSQFLSEEDENFGKKCHALVLSGGGAHGSYEAGVMWSLFKSKPEDFKYDVVTGVSAGSINALAFSAFEIGDELNFIEWISKTWE
jgi:predicted acylesterase/phospholipase RssA